MKTKKINRYSECCFEKLEKSEDEWFCRCSKCKKIEEKSFSKGAVIMKFEVKYQLNKVNEIEKNIFDFRFYVFDFETIKQALRENWTFEKLIQNHGKL